LTTRQRLAYWITWSTAFLGIVAAGIEVWFGYRNVKLFDRPLCPVLEDNFETLNTDVWAHEVLLGGFGYALLSLHTLSADQSIVAESSR
jgi:hypothetical protein